jgi:Undecaprenyl-phosphate galactose phosphotransferase WbaP
MTPFSPEQLNLEVDEDSLDAPAAESAAAATPHLGVDRRAALHASLVVQQTVDATAQRRLRRAGFVRSILTTSPLLAADVLALALCGLIAWKLVAFLSPSSLILIRWAAPLTLAAMIPTYWIWGLYDAFGVHPVVEQRQLTAAHLCVVIASCVGALFVPAFAIWCAALLVTACVLVPMSRMLIRRWCAHQSWWGFPTLLVGSSSSMGAMADMLLTNCSSGLRAVAATCAIGPCPESSLPIVSEPHAIESLVHDRVIRHAVISLPEGSPAELSRVVSRYEKIIPHLIILSDCNLLPGLWGVSRSCGRYTGMEVQNRSTFITLLAIKRAIDLVVASLAAIILLPLMIAIAVAVRLSSPGPIFFGHKRIGLRGKRFETWKFRTMYCDSDHILADHFRNDPAAHQAWIREHKLRFDPRVTRIGNILRQWSLDELPQLWNVLAGQMSLVGPRPIVDDEIAKYGAVFDLYISVRPGITGLWQVSGRNDMTYSERVALDQYFVRNWSPWLDLYILPKTLWALLRRKGAY